MCFSADASLLSDRNHSCPPGCSAGPKVESTDTGDPPLGLMGNEGSSDPFSP